MAVRGFLRDCLADRADLDRELAILLASELATDAIVYSRLTFDVRVDLSATCVCVEVDELSAVLPVSIRPGPDRNAGLGLAIVEAGADRWGVQTTAGGTRTWFEVCSDTACDS
jgi:hypothetical protein